MPAAVHAVVCAALAYVQDLWGGSDTRCARGSHMAAISAHSLPAEISHVGLSDPSAWPRTDTCRVDRRRRVGQGRVGHLRARLGCRRGDQRGPW